MGHCSTTLATGVSRDVSSSVSFLEIFLWAVTSSGIWQNYILKKTEFKNMDAQMLGFTSGFLAVPGLCLVGKHVCDAELPSRVSVVWLGRCESPQALTSLSRFILVLREL